MREAGRQSDGQALESQRASARRWSAGRPLAAASSVGVYTTLLADGNLFYYLTVVPEGDAPTYAAVFDRVGQSIRLTDR